MALVAVCYNGLASKLEYVLVIVYTVVGPGYFSSILQFNMFLFFSSVLLIRLHVDNGS